MWGITERGTHNYTVLTREREKGVMAGEGRGEDTETRGAYRALLASNHTHGK